MLPLKTAREASAKAKSAWESTKAAMKEAGQDTKEGITERFEKQELTEMKPALKVGFVFKYVPLPLTLHME
jgi:hypothetical protein